MPIQVHRGRGLRGSAEGQGIQTGGVAGEETQGEAGAQARRGRYTKWKEGGMSMGQCFIIGIGAGIWVWLWWSYVELQAIRKDLHAILEEFKGRGRG